MGQIFVSYSRQDSEIVDRLITKLEAAGFDVWRDREKIEGGEKWRASIVRAIKKSDAIIVVLSPNSMISDNVRKELDLAEAGKIPIRPVDAEPAAMSDEFEYHLAGLQRINLYSDFDTGCKRLIKALGGEKRKKSAPPKRVATPAPSETLEEDQSRFSIVGSWEGLETVWGGRTLLVTMRFTDDGLCFERTQTGGGTTYRDGKYTVDLSAEPARLEIQFKQRTSGWAANTMRGLLKIFDNDTIQIQFLSIFEQHDSPSYILESAPIYKRKR